MGRVFNRVQVDDVTFGVNQQPTEYSQLDVLLPLRESVENRSPGYKKATLIPHYTQCSRYYDFNRKPQKTQ